ncbi:hypothetical protein [Methanobacterium sp.]|uniref:hypothetical protein n=1 Tax=Methanobacterium sp. TaxID=2164 RepID=UPI003C77B262
MNKTSPELKKLFLTYIKDMGETSGGFFSFVNPEAIVNGNPKELGQELQKGATIMESRLEDMKFQPYEHEKGKTRWRLKESLNMLREMGKEMENIPDQEPNDYHWYIIAINMDIVSSLFNHIEIYLAEYPP